MDFVIDPKTAMVRVQLTPLGKSLYHESLLRLKELSQDDAVRLAELVPTTVVPDAKGYYEMQLWVFIRAFGGYGLFGALWLRQYVVGDICLITEQQLVAAVTYPG